MKTLHFKSETGYHKWLAAGHIHGYFAETPGNENIFIKGKHHHVKHEKY